MQRSMSIAMAAAVLAGGLALAPTHGQAQSSYYQNGQTTTGDNWMNENDYDYNRQHMTPPNRPMNRSQNDDNSNNYGYNNGYDRDYQNNNRGYDGNDGQYRTQRRPDDYGQYRSYDPRYGQGYTQQPYNNQQGYDRRQPSYDDQQ